MATQTQRTRTCDTCPDGENEIPRDARFFRVQRLYDTLVGKHEMTYTASNELDLCEKCATGLGLASLVTE